MPNESAPDLSLFFNILDPILSADFDEAYITAQASTLGHDVIELWVATQTAARQEADRDRF